MVQSPSWEANRFAANQEIPRISRNPKVHYRTHKRLPPVSIRGQSNLVHIPKSHLLEIHPNIIKPSTPRSPQWSLSLRFPHQDPIHPCPHPYLPHAQPISFDGERIGPKNTELFEMIVGVLTTCHLVLQMQPHVISFYGVTSRIRFMFLLFPQVSRNWGYESEPPLKPSPLTLLQTVWNELDYRVDICRITKGAHIEHL